VEANAYAIVLTRVEVEAGKGSTEQNAVNYHLQLLLPNTPMLLVQQLHDMCTIENCSLWDETLENAVKELDVDVVETQAGADHTSYDEYAEQGTVGDMSLEELERFLSDVKVSGLCSGVVSVMWASEASRKKNLCPFQSTHHPFWHGLNPNTLRYTH
jgi:hypothetical protein